IADGSESVSQRASCRHRSQNRAIRNRVLQQLDVIIFGGDVALQQYVGMRVDETGQADLAAEIDDLRTALVGDKVADLVDLFSHYAEGNILACGVTLAIVKRS